MEETKELVPVGETAVAVAVMPDFEEDAGAGLEQVTAKDIAIPFLSVLQTNSPQVDDTGGKYIPGAKPGMIFNTVTNQLYDAFRTPIRVIPVSFRKEIVEWKPRDSGGGIVARHAIGAAPQSAKNEKGKDVTAAGNILEETAYHFVLVLTESGGANWALLALKSTALKVSRKWNTIMSGLRLTGKDGRPFNPPSFSHIYSLRVVKEENAQGKWFNLSLDGEPKRLEDPTLYAEAKTYLESIRGGKAKVAEESAGEVHDAEAVPF